MAELQVLLIAGTHGNEINAPWFFKQWKHNPKLINSNGIKLEKVIGNPLSLKDSRRYIDCDLNRSFRSDLLSTNKSKS